MKGVVLGLLLLLAAPASWAEVSGLHHDLTVSIDPATRQLRAEDTITFTGQGSLQLLLAPHFSVTQLSVDDKAVPIASARREIVAGLRVWQLDLDKDPRARRINLAYAGQLAPLETLDHRSVLGPLPALSAPQGSFLPAGAGWYPLVEGKMFTYRLELDLPLDQRGLVPGKLVKEPQDKHRYRAVFDFSHPAEGIDLLAGPYQIKEINKNGIRLRTYFHPEISELAADYLDSISSYIELYDNWIGPYPYTEFSVVSSPLPTGFGMPTLTYMGIDVLRLPFIRFGSLGHEILHNWWANGVYVDWPSGNWSEGLTTFMADYTYTEQQSAAAARDMRLAWLRDFAALADGQDQPLRDFTSRSHSASQIVGYHKAAMLFLMLRDRLGPEVFDKGLRQFWKERLFRVSGWDDLRQAFEKSSGAELKAFFEQWLTRRGAPRLSVEEENVTAQDNDQKTYYVAFTLSQPEPAYILRVPLVLNTAAGPEEHVVDLSQAHGDYVLETTARPLSLRIDPEFRLFRAIDPGEAPPILRQVITDPTSLTLLPGSDEAVNHAGKMLAQRLLDSPPRLAHRWEASPNPVPLLIIGTHTEVDRFLAQHKLPPRPAHLTGKGSAQVWAKRQVNGKVMVVVSANNAESLQALIRPLPHYGKESLLSFDNAKLIERGTWPSQTKEWPLAAPP